MPCETVNNDFHQRECKIVNQTGNASISEVTNDSVENSTQNNCVSTTEIFITVPLSDCANGNTNMAHKLRSNNGATCTRPRLMSHFW